MQALSYAAAKRRALASLAPVQPRNERAHIYICENKTTSEMSSRTSSQSNAGVRGGSRCWKAPRNRRSIGGRRSVQVEKIFNPAERTVSKIKRGPVYTSKRPACRTVCVSARLVPCLAFRRSATRHARASSKRVAPSQVFPASVGRPTPAFRSGTVGRSFRFACSFVIVPRQN